jgi:hypothetical protein
MNMCAKCGAETVSPTFNTVDGVRCLDCYGAEDLPFVKADVDKPRPELIPPGFIMLLGDVFAFGAKKYSVDNWQKCDDPRCYIGAALRHLLLYAEGEILDESGFHHLGHAAASIAMLWGITEGKK